MSEQDGQIIDASVTNTEPYTRDEVLKATPKTLVSALSVLISSWFGSEHYAANTRLAKKYIAHPISGEKLIRSELGFSNALFDIIGAWKADSKQRNTGTLDYSNRDVVDRIRKYAREYGLHNEIELLNTYETRYAPDLTDKTLTGRRSLRDFLARSNSSFFNLFMSATDEQIPRTSDSRVVLESNIENIQRFVDAHDRKIINFFRVPLALVLTGATIYAVGKAYIQDERQETKIRRKLKEIDARLGTVTDQVKSWSERHEDSPEKLESKQPTPSR